MTFPELEGLTVDEQVIAVTEYHANQREQALRDMRLSNPADLTLVSDGYGEYSDGYKLTEAGIKLVLDTIDMPVCAQRKDDHCGHCNWCKGREASLARTAEQRCDSCGRINCPTIFCGRWSAWRR